MPLPSPLTLEDTVLAVYCALDDALAQAKIRAHDGKLIPRRGPPPDIDDREVLCLALLQEIFGFESDYAYHLWLQANPLMRDLFPRMLSRQKFADRRVLLTPLLKQLAYAFCILAGEVAPPFSSSTRIPYMFVNSFEGKVVNV